MGLHTLGAGIEQGIELGSCAATLKREYLPCELGMPSNNGGKGKVFVLSTSNMNQNNFGTIYTSNSIRSRRRADDG